MSEPKMAIEHIAKAFMELFVEWSDGTIPCLEEIDEMMPCVEEWVEEHIEEIEEFLLPLQEKLIEGWA